MGQLRAFLLLLSLCLIGFASCGTLNLNTTTTTTTKAATPLPTTEPTFTAGSSTLRTAEPTVTIEPQTTKAAGSTKTFPSSTTLTSTSTTSTTTAKPLLILTTTTTTTNTSSSSSPAPWFIEEEKDFADDLLQAQAPIEAKLPTSGCKAAAFSSVLSSAAASPANGGDGILAGPSSLPRREKIFVRVPSEQCPPEITRKAIAELNNLRHCQGLAEMAHSEALAAEAGRWAAETATQGVVYKPGYSGAGQYATSTAAPYAVFSLDLSGFEVLGKWKGSGNNYLPWYTGGSGGGTAPRHFTNDEWRRVREFGVGCAAYRFRTAKAMFWTVVFFRKA